MLPDSVLGSFSDLGTVSLWRGDKPPAGSGLGASVSSPNPKLSGQSDERIPRCLQCIEVLGPRIRPLKEHGGVGLQNKIRLFMGYRE